MWTIAAMQSLRMTGGSMLVVHVGAWRTACAPLRRPEDADGRPSTARGMPTLCVGESIRCPSMSTR